MKVEDRHSVCVPNGHVARCSGLQATLGAQALSLCSNVFVQSALNQKGAAESSIGETIYTKAAGARQFLHDDNRP